MTTATAVREKPILFSGEMVRAILEGRKTQTRRAIDSRIYIELTASEEPDSIAIGHVEQHEEGFGAAAMEHMRCPFGYPGDRLWVRENWQALRLSYDFETGYCDDWFPCDPEEVREYLANPNHQVHNPSFAITRQSETWPEHRDDRGFSWRPSIHMPRWASRLTLEITEVRVQRVQEIRAVEAASEGFDANDGANVQRFRTYWDSLNAKRGYSWQANPWVWALTFKVVS